MIVIWVSQYGGVLKLESLCFHQTSKQVHISGKEANHCPAWLAPPRQIGESSVPSSPICCSTRGRARVQEIMLSILPGIEPSGVSRTFWTAFSRFLLSCGKKAFQNWITFFMTPQLLRLQPANHLGNGRVLFHVPSGLKWVWCFLCSFRSNDHVMEFWPQIIQWHDSGLSPVALCDIGLVLIIGDTSVCAFSKLQVCPALRKLETASDACLRWMPLHEGASVCTLKIGWLYKIIYHKIPLNN